ncbi:MAG: hypothetical protein KAW83_03015 [Dehalococcoidia bacterium]|nr:hypothetical protein [Dehalococcoidia bacterium]
MDTYVLPEGELSTVHFDFKVAHRGGEPCPVCGSTIERVLVQNRGTCFCPRCQLFCFRPSDIKTDSSGI